jgi:predicted Holliday junction resolvase-like endonuclease
MFHKYKNIFIIIAIILVLHFILKNNSIISIDNFASVESSPNIEKQWDLKDRELSPMEINKLKKFQQNKENDEFNNWHNENRDNYNSAHLDINTNESIYTRYRGEPNQINNDEFAGTTYY